MINIPDKETHIWIFRINPDLTNKLEPYSYSIISNKELKKVNHLKLKHLKHQALITRAFVRTTLSHYTLIPPNEWIFSENQYNKPEIDNEDNTLRFNISHSKELIACAITRNDAVGIDVEAIDPDENILSIADQYFSKQEIFDLLRLHTIEQRIHHFFNLWTLKESYIKACGLGLSLPLDQFSFTLSPETKSQLIKSAKISIDDHSQAPFKDCLSWSISYFKGFKMALTVNANNHKTYNLRFFETKTFYDPEEIKLTN